MQKIEAFEYKWFLEFCADHHLDLAEYYGTMQKIIRFFEAFMGPKQNTLFTQLKILKRIIEQSQSMNHRAYTSAHHCLKAFKAQAGETFVKRLKACLSFKMVELGTCYLTLQEEDQIYVFLKVQHDKLEAILDQMYELGLLEQLSRIDSHRVNSLYFFLKLARIVNKEVIRNCNRLRKVLKRRMPYEVPMVRFQSLMNHCNSWGSKAYTLPKKPKGVFTRLHEKCSLVWGFVFS